MWRGLFGGGWALLQGAALCFGMVGCAAQHDDSLRLSEELGRARADAAWQQSRAAELEARVSRLEQRAADGAHVGSAQNDKVLLRLDELVELNQSLLASRATAPLSDVTANTPPQAKPSAGITAVAAAREAQVASNTSAAAVVATASGSAATAMTPEQQLRALVESLRGRPGRLHGTLTREQEDALRVLTRTERTLDADNPYPAGFY